jgi:hypothetical protein
MKQLRAGLPLAGFKIPASAPAVPAPGYPGSDVSLSHPLALPAPFAPSLASQRPRTQMPMSPFIALEYYCARGRGVPVAALAWEPALALEIALPRLALKAIIPPVERARRKTDALPISPVGVLPMAKPKMSARRLFAKYGPAAIAASVILFASVWFGTRPTQPAVNRKVIAGAGAASRAAPAQERLNPVVWAKRTIEKRATVQVTDTFKQGMAAWGVPKGWMAGWSRHPDGYVRPGQLALFQPTSTFTDYRLEFFGQVEDRGMGWAVRARDPRNYYAMKLKVLAGGLRPVLEMIYYPVVGGKPGHQVKVPLSVMIHANTPYHVAVKVAGNRLTASVEGQEVDSWTDDVEPSGAVGFFTEPGERARLYWMKVYKNDDWLGRVCGFLTGNSAEEPAQTAWLNRPATLLPHPGNLVPLFPEPAIIARERNHLLRGGLERRVATSPVTARIGTFVKTSTPREKPGSLRFPGTLSSGHGTSHERILPWNS